MHIYMAFKNKVWNKIDKKLKILSSLQKAPNTVYLASNKIHQC